MLHTFIYFYVLVELSSHLSLSEATCRFSSFWNQPSVKNWLSKGSCADGKMWVSVLVLWAAEHPVPLLPGPRYPSACLWLPALSTKPSR